jgi:hypothetical protein
MPEQYRRPAWHDASKRAERVQFTFEDERDALALIAQFNERAKAKRVTLFWPTLDAALASKHHWLRVLCETCGGIASVDLRMKPRDPRVSVRVVLRDVKCPRCNGHGKPTVVGLSPQP